MQVLVSCLYQQLVSAHSDSASQQNLHNWAREQSSAVLMFLYWYNILEFEVTILLFVRSFREGNLVLLLRCLKRAVKLCTRPYELFQVAFCVDPRFGDAKS